MFLGIRGHTVYAKALHNAPIVIDLGANRGEFSQQCAALFGARCFLVEANPSLASRLDRDTPFPIWKCAISGTAGAAWLNIACNDEASSMLALSATSLHAGGVRDTVQVEAKTLECLLAEIGHAHIDLLKMDIEGAEVEVFLNTPEAVLRRIDQITVEFHSHPEFGFAIRDEVENVMQIMGGFGFIAMDFSYGSRCDVLFINRGSLHVSWLRQTLWKMRLTPPGWLDEVWRRSQKHVRPRLRAFVNRFAGIDRSR